VLVNDTWKQKTAAIKNAVIFVERNPQ